MVQQVQNNQALITDIKQDIAYIRLITISSNDLTNEEKQSLKKLPKDQRESAKLKLITQKKEQKQLKIRQCLENLEIKIAAAGVSIETSNNLHDAIEKIKDNGYACSPQTATKITQTKVEKEAKDNTTNKQDILGQNALNELLNVFGKSAVNMLMMTLNLLGFAVSTIARRRTPPRPRQPHTRP